MRRQGFTLAEVLITLVIIGVIAAMTIPTLMNNTNSQEYRSGIKKAISVLNQALTMQYALDGTQIADYTASTAAQVRDLVFAKRLNVISTSDSGTIGATTGATLFYTADGMKFAIAKIASATCDAEGATPCFDITIDVNGDKRPNTLTAGATKPSDIYSAKLYSQRVVPFDVATQGVIFDK